MPLVFYLLINCYYFSYFRMAEMLAKFRIDYSDLIMIPDYNKKPQETTVNYFESIIANFRSEGNDMKGDNICLLFFTKRKQVLTILL